MATLKQLEHEISLIKARNKRVELDKAWETSWARRIVLFVMTYIVVLILFLSAGLPDPYLSSLVPALAFVLSTMTLPLFKLWWLNAR